MSLLATAIVDWNAMWKIFVVALAAGAGVVVVFGFLLLGVKISNRPGGSRVAGLSLSVVCGVIVIGVVVIGVYAMTKKPSSKPAKTAKTKSALVIPDATQIASSR